MVRPLKNKIPLLIPPSKERLNAKILSQIKRFIFSSKINNGQKLPSERELSIRLKVSRVVVREALRSLEQSGFVEIKTGAKGGSFVTENLHLPLANCVFDLMTNNKLTLSHFVEVRKTIETCTVRLAVQRGTPKDYEKLNQINRDLLEGIQHRAKFRELNRDFHVMIAEMSGNPLLKLIVQSILELLMKLRPDFYQPARFIRSTYERHVALIKSMKEGNIALCEELMTIDAQSTKELKTRKSYLPPAF
jgi:DNA-binding FadR family transcriptional regulator